MSRPRRHAGTPPPGISQSSTYKPDAAPGFCVGIRKGTKRIFDGKMISVDLQKSPGLESTITNNNPVLETQWRLASYSARRRIPLHSTAMPRVVAGSPLFGCRTVVESYSRRMLYAHEHAPKTLLPRITHHYCSRRATSALTVALLVDMLLL